MSNENKNPYPYHAFHQDHHHHPLPQGFAFPIVTDHNTFNPLITHNHQNPNDQFDPMSFSNCLQGAVEYNTLSAAFDLSCSQSEVAADNPRSSASFSSLEAGVEQDSGKDKACEQGDGKSKNHVKAKKKEEKKKREARFAFMTKSEVDNLEDGYRWRKYGQKAVKNSPFPRSYYRCTSQKCDVKKRIERSFQDPSVVVTTYEGQHSHHSPAAIRGSAAAVLPPPLFTPYLFPQTNLQPFSSTQHQQYQEQLPHEIPDHYSFFINGMVSSFLHKPQPN